MRRNIAVPAAIDVLCILVFVAIGRRSHDESGSVLVGAARVAAPFLISLAVGWVVLRMWTAPRSVDKAVPLWLITVVIGLVLRNLVFDRGTALPFIIVATLFTGLLLVGWRLLANRRRPVPPSTRLGLFRGQISMSSDFDKTPDDIAEHFES